MVMSVDMRKISKQDCEAQHFTYADHCIPIMTRIKKLGLDAEACHSINATRHPYDQKVMGCKTFAIGGVKPCRWDKRCYIS